MLPSPIPGDVSLESSGGGVTVQRQVRYLGEINTTQEAAWRQTLEVFDEHRAQLLRRVRLHR